MLREKLGGGCRPRIQLNKLGECLAEYWCHLVHMREGPSKTFENKVNSQQSPSEWNFAGRHVALQLALESGKKNVLPQCHMLKSLVKLYITLSPTTST